MLWKCIPGMWDLIKMWCGIRKNANFTDGIRELSTLPEAGFPKFFARDA